MALKLFWLALAGAGGTLSRYGLGLWVQRLHGGPYPWGTWAINGSGCFLFGFVWSLAEVRGRIQPDTRVLVLAGFTAAFTTFSTYVFETSQMLKSEQWMGALANFAGQNALGLVLLSLGSKLADLF